MARTTKKEPASSNRNGIDTGREVRAGRPQRSGQVPVESDRDDPDPRVVRSKYRALHNKINEKRDDLMRLDSDKFNSMIKEVEDLHLLVRKPREQVADAEALLDLATTLASSVRSQSNEGITVADFVSCLLTEFGQSCPRLDNEDVDDHQVSIKWKEVGLAVSPIFRMCNGFSTMLGPTNVELKQRRAAVHRNRARPAQAARPEEVVDGGTGQKTDTDKNMATMFDILKRKKSVRLENLVLNRKSFAQTVENLFALSFLVKDGRVDMTVDETGAHHISPRNAPAAVSIMSGEVKYRHFVFRYDFKDWKLMTRVVVDGEELMPHRESQDIGSQEEPAANITQGTQPRTPIRKLSRNRGRIVQEDLIVHDSPETNADPVEASGLRRCKRKLT